MAGFGRLLARWVALKGRQAAGRVLWAVQVAAVAMGLATAALAAAYAGHLLAGVPAHLEALPWLEGPRWATAAGLALRLVVAWILFDAARAGRRRLSRGAGGG